MFSEKKSGKLIPDQHHMLSGWREKPGIKVEINTQNLKKSIRLIIGIDVGLKSKLYN